jgi:hypothetical protein
MEIVRKEIPKEFLETLPEGMKFITKGGKEFLVIEQLYCPNGHNLVDNTVHIHGESAVRIKIKVGDCEGTIFLDAFWGSHAKLYSFIPERSSAMKMLKAFCPVCGTSLIVDVKCNQSKCDSEQSIQLLLPGKNNKILACAKLGCPGHSIEIKEMRKKTVKRVNEINYFGISLDDDDLFKGV